MTQRSRNRLWDTVLMMVVLAACIVPLVWTIFASFGIYPNNNISPPVWAVNPTLDNYIEVGVTDTGFLPSITTSLALSILTTLLTVTTAFLAVYALVHSRFRGQDLIVQSLLILASLPVISYVIPLQNILRSVRLFDTFLGITFSETGLFAPLAAYVLHGYLSQLSPEIEDAARLDGTNLFQMLRWVVLPVITPGLAATAIIIFVLSWNQLLLPLILTGKLKTLPTYMIDSFTYERELEWPVAAAGLVVSLLPVGIFVALAHRLLERFHLVALHQTD